MAGRPKPVKANKQARNPEYETSLAREIRRAVQAFKAKGAPARQQALKRAGLIKK